MTLLDEKRQEIDRIDQEMTRLFAARMACVQEISAYKKEHGLPIESRSREEAVLNQNLELLPASLHPYYPAFCQQVMDCAKQYQADLRRNETK